MATITRRSLVEGGVACGVCIATGSVAKALSGENELLRPPGAQDEDHFNGACLRCNKCISACPLACLRYGTVADGFLNARTPIIDFHRGYCDFCGKCEDACPTGAIHDVNENTSIIGVAVVDEERCVAFEQRGCRVCAEKCPYGAITVNESSHPVVDASKCNGCGVCENVCPSNTYRSYTGGKLRGINVEKVEA